MMPIFLRSKDCFANMFHTGKHSQKLYLVPMECGVPLVPMECRVPLVPMECQVPLVPMECGVPLVPMECGVPLGRQTKLISSYYGFFGGAGGMWKPG